MLLAESGRIEGLVNQWMFLARPSPPSVAPADLAALVAETLRAHAAQAAHAGVTFAAEIPAPLLALADARRLTQAIRNVVVNAIHAMPAGGVLRITGDAGANSVRLVFHDSGPGFSPAALARHAELFFSEKEGGMGIGLSVSAEILHAHGGRLEAANAPTGGATVTLLLPVLPL